MMKTMKMHVMNMVKMYDVAQMTKIVNGNKGYEGGEDK